MAAPARKYHTQQVHYLKASVAYTDEDVAVEIGTLPNGAVIIGAASGVAVETAFNDSGTDLLDIGYAAHVDSSGSAVTADPDHYATDLDVSAAGFIALDEVAASDVVDCNDGGVPVTATFAGQNSNASAGLAQVVICYVV